MRYQYKNVGGIFQGRMRRSFLMLCFTVMLFFCDNGTVSGQGRHTVDFNSDWFFCMDSVTDYHKNDVDYADWRKLDLPHDWSIELPFDEKSKAGSSGGYLSGGTGWYKKAFKLNPGLENNKMFIEFGGVYENSQVWINGKLLGKRPNGYIGFSYDLTDYLFWNGTENTITVKADNSQQPNSRFYTGSGIYRNVKLIYRDKISVGYQGTFVKSTNVGKDGASLEVQAEIENYHGTSKTVKVITQIVDANQQMVTESSRDFKLLTNKTVINQHLNVPNPILWDLQDPYQYRAVILIQDGGETLDTYETKFGIRSFEFDSDKGFVLNGEPIKIQGVCLHSDLGALGMAFNRSAALRQLRIMKEMGVNGIRTAHNPAAEEFLDLCDSLGFVVMSETFDVWKSHKNPFDYHLYWDDWHIRDFEDHIKRDRNRPSIFVWCLGNEAQEQWHQREYGEKIPQDLASIVNRLDGTRPTTIASNELSVDNPVLESTAVDIIGYNYNHKKWPSFPTDQPGKKLIVTESTSALETRGQYDAWPVDSLRMWPVRWDIPFNGGNVNKCISAYDHVHTPWGSTHEASLKLLKTHDFISGMYVWTGFDYLGEPTPYTWPARSSYFGIVDLAGFPKDVYYLYQSEWTKKDVLHVFPHWNWPLGDTVEVVAYYNNADSIALLLNGKLLGVKSKGNDELHVKWQIPFEPGEIMAIAFHDGKEVNRSVRRTAGEVAALNMESNLTSINYTANELAFVEVTAVDKYGVEVPHFNEEIVFEIVGEGEIIGTDNGSPTDLTSFQSLSRTALNGKILAIVKANAKDKRIQLTAKTKNGIVQQLELTTK